MLKVNLDPRFTENVEITVPGQKETANVSLDFIYRDRDTLAAFWEEYKDKKEIEVMTEIIVGWGGFDLEFSEENLEKLLLNYPAASGEIITAYHELLLGSRVKN